MFMDITACTHETEMPQGKAVELVLEYTLKKYMPLSAKILNKTRACICLYKIRPVSLSGQAGRQFSFTLVLINSRAYLVGLHP